MLDWEDAALWEEANGLLILADSHDGCVGLLLHEVVHLPVSVEEHHACLHHVLEDEEFVVVADFTNIAHYEVIEDCFPLCSHFMSLGEIVNLLLCHISVQDLLVHACSEIRRNTTLCILHQEGLVFLLEKTLTN